MSTPFSVYEPFPQFHDRAGQPLEAGSIYIGIANMDPVANPLQVYWDAALSIPAVQPIKTLAGYPVYNGSPATFYANATDYSTRVIDRQGSLVFSSPSCAERLPYTLISGTGIPADNVSFTALGFGHATDETVGRKLSYDLVSVFDFMTDAECLDVSGNFGAFDVTAAIHNAINASGSKPCEVYFPPGTYRVSSTGAPGILVTKSGVTLRGAGKGATVIHYVGNDVALAVKGDAITFLEAVHVADMTIVGSAASTYGVQVSYTRRSSFERLNLWQHGKDGLRASFTQWCAFRDVDSHDNIEHGAVFGEAANYNTTSGGELYGNSVGGLLVTLDGATNRPIGNSFVGLHCQANPFNVAIYSGDENKFTGCNFASASGTSLVVSRDAAAIGAAANVFDACVFPGTSPADVVINHATDTTLANCTGYNAWSVLANADRTRIVNCITGALADAGTGTFETSVSSTEAVQSTSSSIMRLAFKAITNAFRFRTLAAGGTFPIFEMAGWRLWVDSSTANLRLKSTDPSAPTDGYSLGPGLDSYTIAGLPVGAPVGMMAIVTDHSALPPPTWGGIPINGGATTAIVINLGGGTWHVIGK